MNFQNKTVKNTTDGDEVRQRHRVFCRKEQGKWHQNGVRLPCDGVRHYAGRIKILALIFNTFLALLLLSTFTFSIGNKATDILRVKTYLHIPGLVVMLILYAYIYFVLLDLARRSTQPELPISDSLFQWGTFGLFAIPALTAFALTASCRPSSPDRSSTYFSCRLSYSRVRSMRWQI